MTKLTERVGNGIYISLTKASNSESFELSSNHAKLQQWIERRRTRAVKLSELYFVVKAAKEYLRTGVEVGRGRHNPCRVNPISVLNEKVQRIWGESIRTDLLNEVDVNEAYIDGVYLNNVHVFGMRITLPDGRSFIGLAPSKPQAKEIAAKKALEHLKTWK